MKLIIKFYSFLVSSPVYLIMSFSSSLLGGANGLHCVMAAHVVPVSDMRLAYGLVLTFGGFTMLSGMPLAGMSKRFTNNM